MPLSHAVIWTDHLAARVFQFDADQVLPTQVHAHKHPTAQHGSGVRAEHEFFGAVCEAVDGVAEVLLTGSHTSLANFRHYVEKHRPQTALRVVGYDVVDHQSDNQLVAHARAVFARRVRLGAT